MTKRVSKFDKVVFSWRMPPEERHKIEEVLASLGYDVDGGGTNLESGTAEIYIRPKKRSHKRKATEVSAV